MGYLERAPRGRNDGYTVETLLRRKGRAVHAVSSQDTVADAIALMLEQDIGAVVVLEQAQLVGILSERDCVRRVMAKRRSPARTRVASVMTRDVIRVRPLQRTDDCLSIMTERHIRHLPVMDGEQVVGLVSLRDLAEVEMNRRQEIIEHLQEFLPG